MKKSLLAVVSTAFVMALSLAGPSPLGGADTASAQEMEHGRGVPCRIC